MKWTRSAVVLGALGLGLLQARPAVAQQTTTDDLKKEIQELREMLQGMQKDIQEIKANMARQAGPRSPVGQTVDFSNSPFRGDPNAKVTLIEISDYQCPFCGRYTRDTLPQVESEYIETGKVKSVFFDMPLESIHKFAFKAAEAASCAGDQGKYWEMHDRLFANQKALEPWTAHAEAIGLDVSAFEECMKSDKHAAEIRREIAEASRLGITGTPGFLLGRTDPKTSKVRILASLRGARPFADFKREIDKLLGEAEQPEAAKPEAANPGR
jgi:protein-disulfide isomerase